MWYVALLLTLASPQGGWEEYHSTLAYVLRKEGVDIPVEEALARKRVVTYEKGEGIEGFAFSVWDDPEKRLVSPLYVYVRRPGDADWRHAAIAEKDMPPDSMVNRGSIVSLEASPHFFFVVTHLNPSANCTLMLDDALRPTDAVLATPVGYFKDDTTVLRPFQVHFAATHPSELALYNPTTKAQRLIYPMKPYQKVRQAHVEALAKVIKQRNETWPDDPNLPSDPEQFTNYIRDVAVSDDLDALAFVSAYDGTELALNPDGLHAGSEDDIFVLYVYRHVRDPKRIEYRELLLTDLKSEFGVDAPAAVLTPELLDRLFRTKP